MVKRGATTNPGVSSGEFGRRQAQFCPGGSQLAATHRLPVAHRQALPQHGAPGAHRARRSREQPIPDPRGGAALGGGGGATTRSGWGRSRRRFSTGATSTRTSATSATSAAPPRPRVGGRARRGARLARHVGGRGGARRHHVVGAAGARRGADLRGVPEDGDLRRAAGADAAVGAGRGAQGDRRRARAAPQQRRRRRRDVDDDDDIDDGAGRHLLRRRRDGDGRRAQGLPRRRVAARSDPGDA